MTNPLRSRAPRAPGTQAPGPRPLVLVVEDDEALQRAFSLLVERAGHEVLATASGREAMQLLHRKPAVILCDYMLPDADGLQVLAVARDVAPEAEFILATAHGSLDVAVRALQLGASDFLSKPLASMELLVDRVRRGVERHRLRREVKRTHDELARANAQLAALVERTERRYVGLTQLLSGMLDLYDVALAAHSRRVGSLAADVARELGLEAHAVRELEVAGVLHDVGYVALPPGTGRGPEATDAARALAGEHPVLGEALLAAMDPEAALFVRHHHERYDGEGYPDGLARSDIPLGARVVAVCERFDEAVTWPDVEGRDATAEALELVRREAGAGLDPLVVEAFEAVWARRHAKRRVIARVRVGDLHAGMVLARPVYSANGLLLLQESQELSDADVARIRSFHRAQPVIDELYVYRDA